LVAAFALLAGACSSGNSDASGPSEGASGEITVADGGSVSVEGVTVAIPAGAVDYDTTLRVTVGAPVKIEGGEAATPMVSATLDEAELTGAATIDLPLSVSDIDPTTVLGGFVDREGKFQPLESTVDVEPGVLHVTTQHFTSFFGIQVDPGAALSAMVDGARNLFTGRAGTDQPRCQGEDAARSDGVEVTSDSGDLVKWCFGRTDGQRQLTVTNNRSAAVLVTFPASWTAGNVSGSGVSFESFGRWLSSQAPNPPGFDSRVIAKGSSIVLTLAKDRPSGTVNVEMDLLTWAFSGFDIAVSTSLAVYRRFLSVSGTTDEIVSGALTAGEAAEAGQFFTCFNDLFSDELDPRQSVADAGFEPTMQALEYGVRCGVDYVKDWIESHGANLVTRTVLAVVSAAFGFVIAGLDSAFAGMRNLFDTFTGSAVYAISVTAPARGLPTLPALRDDGLGPIIVGMSIDEALATGWLGDELVSCSELLGIGDGVTERTFALGGPAAPAGLAGRVVFIDGTLYEVQALSGVLVGGALELATHLTPSDAADALEAAGYDVEITAAFEPEDYLTATEGDGDTLSIFFQDGPLAGLPQLTTCD
jgi:hypothetical protein